MRGRKERFGSTERGRCPWERKGEGKAQAYSIEREPPMLV